MAIFAPISSQDLSLAKARPTGVENTPPLPITITSEFGGAPSLTSASLGYSSALLDGPRGVDVVGPDDDQLRHVHAPQSFCKGFRRRRVRPWLREQQQHTRIPACRTAKHSFGDTRTTTNSLGLKGICCVGRTERLQTHTKNANIITRCTEKTRHEPQTWGLHVEGILIRTDVWGGHAILEVGHLLLFLSVSSLPSSPRFSRRSFADVVSAMEREWGWGTDAVETC